ncbi:lactadherin-like isoform X2 [Dendronephthya gigantea]|uniref:lactadherin-like isoform X2 n=1 Tax=Dendronephthya gigantea TaxID=151771 RepID=UPI00106A99FF|nr:lactadherin-like isoform X2 [Dendronephthya gigantea]
MVRLFTQDLLWWLVLTYCFKQIVASKDCSDNGHECQNGGVCEGSPLECSCPPAYRGKKCDQTHNNCNHDPCLHGGTCADVHSGFSCSCTPQYVGTYCETEAPCYSNPCQHGGTCTEVNEDGTHQYRCTCPPGYVGTNCDEQCSLSCIPGQGLCLSNFKGNHYCYCIIGFSGTLCEISEMANFECENPLGVDDSKRLIQDNQMGSSTPINTEFAARYGRLNHPDRAWCSMIPTPTKQMSMKITLNNVSFISALAMQGDPNGNNYVNEFQITVLEPADVSRVIGPFTNQYSDPYSINKHRFHPFLQAIGIRVRVLAFTGHYPCIRVELYGCAVSLAEQSMTNCLTTLGLRDSQAFPDSSFTGSDDLDDHKPHNSRLDDPKGWCTADKSGPKLLVQLPKRDLQVVGVMTRGADSKWVKSYKIGTSENWAKVANYKILEGNYEQNEIRTHFFDTSIPLQNNGTLLTIKPQTFTTRPCMRFELIACGKFPVL